MQQHIIGLEPRPPRQVDTTIPKELERICLKALAKRASERYLTAKDLADDLKQFHAQPSSPVETLTKTEHSQSQFRLAFQAKKLGCAFSVTLASLLLAVGYFSFLAVLSPPSPGPQPRNRPILEVSRNAAKPNCYRTIQTALRYAVPGDIIELTDDIHQENLVVDPRTNMVTDITLQAAPGKEVLWTSAKSDDATFLISLNKAKNFRIKGKGIILDGTLGKDSRVKDLILISGNSSGLKLEDLQCRGFAHTAVTIMNCMGTNEYPVRLLNLQTITVAPETPRAAIFFDANPAVQPPFNDFIHISDTCTFLGFDPKQAVGFKDKNVLGNNVSWKTK